MKVNVLGVPDSAGAYCVGVEQAPQALRAAGLIEALTAAGHEIVDHGDLTTRYWRPDRRHPMLQNVDDEVKATQELARRAAELLASGDRLLVLGGSCVVALGLCAAFVAAGERARLVYIDRHFDLNTPLTTSEGSLSWMGMAHALAVHGAAEELIAVLPHPTLRPSDLVYLGVDRSAATVGELSHLDRLEVPVVGQDALVTAPQRAARVALDRLGEGPFAVHVDVDVLDFLDAPMAENVNGRNSGPSILQLAEALRELWQHGDCWAVSIGQLDPAHASSDPTVLTRFVDGLAYAARDTRRRE